jgi:soluble lytic murein transglycosylase-like protein
MKHSTFSLITTHNTQRAALAAIGLCCVLEMMAAITAAGQTSGKEVQPRSEQQTSPLAAQRTAAAAMAESLAKQRMSIQTQVGTSEATGFFELPAPERSATISPVSITSRSRMPSGFDCEALAEEEIGALVDRASKSELIEPELVKGVMRQESGFYPCAVSPKGAMGLMQLMPETASQFQVKDPFDAESNVRAGAKLLKQLLDRYNGNLEKALSAYNAGSARVDAAGGIPNIPETIGYVKQIMSLLPKSR